MAESVEDFSVHRFIRELFEDLSLTLPSLGCRFEGQVTPSSLTVRGQAVFLKNKLFLLFADLAGGCPQLKVKMRPSVRGTDLILSFACDPPVEGRMASMPSWDPGLFTPYISPEGAGFQLALPAGDPPEPALAVDWHRLAQLYGGAAHGRQILSAFVRRAETLVPDLERAVTSADPAAVLRVSHTLKGSARGAAAEALADAALQLEMQARAGDLAPARDLYKALLDTYHDFIRTVQEGSS